MPTPVAIPANAAELLQNPQRVRDALALLNALAQMEVHLVTPQNVSALAPGNKPLRGDPPSIILPLPFKFTEAIDDCDETDLNDVGLTLNALLEQLRRTGVNPS